MDSATHRRHDPRYEVVRTRRRTYAIHIKPDGRVIVRVPVRAPERAITRFVEENEGWIHRSVAMVRRQRAEVTSRTFADGSTVPFRGGELVLRLGSAASRDAPEQWPRGNELHLPRVAAEADRAARRRAVIEWMLDQAPQIVDRAHRDAAARVGLSAVRVTLKDMKSRWGSCGPSRRMSVCWRLVLAPPEILDYVLVHELCHIAIPNHSQAFWRRVERACPDWRPLRGWLKQNGRSLHL